MDLKFFFLLSSENLLVFVLQNSDLLLWAVKGSLLQNLDLMSRHVMYILKGPKINSS